MPPLSRHLEYISRFLICAAVLSSFVSGMTLWNRVFLQQNREHYRPASFVVTGASYEGYGDGTVAYHLTGNIAGREEDFTPRFAKGARPQSVNDLLRIYPKGTEIGVVFNPEVSGMTSLNGEELRVIQAGPAFWEEESRSLRQAALLTFAPIPLATGLFLTIRRMNHRHRAKPKDISTRL